MTAEQKQIDPINVIEAMLFASAEPISVNMIYERVPSDVDVGSILKDLQATYEGRGINLVEVDGKWAFRTVKEVGDSLQLTKEVQRKLSRAAMETLAIVAYHQPVTRAEIENIRGVATHKGTLDVLMECGWIKPGRRRESPGRPLTWITTTNFLDHFGLESLMDLPGLDELKASGLLDRRPAIETIRMTEELFDDEDLEQTEKAEETAEDNNEKEEEE